VQRNEILELKLSILSYYGPQILKKFIISNRVTPNSVSTRANSPSLIIGLDPVIRGGGLGVNLSSFVPEKARLLRINFITVK